LWTGFCRLRHHLVKSIDERQVGAGNQVAVDVDRHLRVQYDGPSKEVTGFEGNGKLLRYIIVPSLRSLH
jgi:hypothetical protein